MIRALHLKEILTSIQQQKKLTVELFNGDAVFAQVNTDTRTLNQGDLFVALRGEKFDAHDFIYQAVAKNPVGLVVEKFFPEISLPQLVVSDCLLALGQIAAFNRQLFAGPVIAITGSSGKTTVKTMLASILQEAGNTHATKGNFNNHIGVPLTLLQLNADHQFAVIEMGASGPNEIAYLCELAKPHVSMINNVMPAHIAGFGSIEGVAKAKGEIYQALEASGVAVINMDDQFSGFWIHSLIRSSVIRVSLQQSTDCYATDIQLHTDTVEFVLHHQKDLCPISLQVPGEHNICNALMSAACAIAVGVDLKKIQRGLKNFSPVSGRMSRHIGINGVDIIDDSYNANPGSVRAAIDVLAKLPKGVLVLGDLAELGEEAEKLHSQLGDYAREKNIYQLFTLGKLSENVSRAFCKNTEGKNSEVKNAEHFVDREKLIEKLKQQANSDITYLIKGSRSAQMDLVVRALCEAGSGKKISNNTNAGDCH
jgi:UDP-N-acetylmuramoyl-tripeptide--D-alanyl-D-alanine ligase